MPSLTVTEKAHWKDRIAKRLDKKIEAFLADEPNLLDRIQAQARPRAVQSLGLADMQTELDALRSLVQRGEQEQAAQHGRGRPYTDLVGSGADGRGWHIPIATNRIAPDHSQTRHSACVRRPFQRPADCDEEVVHRDRHTKP